MKLGIGMAQMEIMFSANYLNHLLTNSVNTLSLNQVPAWNNL